MRALRSCIELDDLQRGDVEVGDLGPHQPIGDHADDLATGCERGVGDGAHQADVAAAVHEPDAAPGDGRAEPLGAAPGTPGRAPTFEPQNTPIAVRSPHRRGRTVAGSGGSTRRYRWLAWVDIADSRPVGRGRRRDLAESVVGTAVRHLTAVGRPRRPSGARLRHRPRRVGGGHGAGPARLRREGRHRGPHHVRLRRRHGPRPDHPPRRPGGAVGGRHRAAARRPPLPRHVPRPRVPRRRSPSRPGRATSTPTWRWCRTRSGRSPTTSSRRRPSTSTAPTATSPRT